MRFGTMMTALAGATMLATGAVAAVSKWVDDGVHGANRSAEARKLDEGRKPAEVLGFLGLKQGMAVADLMTGSGYWAEIIANALDGTGKVTAFEPEQFYNDPEEQKVLTSLVERHKDIELVRYPFERFDAGGRTFDFVMISLNYHDVYWESEKYGIPRGDPKAFMAALAAAVKKGGVVGVIDHVGPAGGDTRATVDKLHRIDPAVVKADFAAAGFKLEASSPLLANPADDHSKLVFDPSVRGKTDRILYRFRKL
jgi:predicted methyltransferase